MKGTEDICSRCGCIRRRRRHETGRDRKRKLCDPCFEAKQGIEPGGIVPVGKYDRPYPPSEGRAYQNH